MKKDVKVATNIAAPRDRVWEIISNFDDWNSWHKSGVQLTTKNGVPTSLRFKQAGLSIRIRLTDVMVVSGEVLQWKGAIPLTGKLLYGIRRFTLTENGPESCELVQEENFYGILSGTVKRGLIEKYTANYNLLNANIKALAEESKVH